MGQVEPFVWCDGCGKPIKFGEVAYVKLPKGTKVADLKPGADLGERMYCAACHARRPGVADIQAEVR